MVRVSLSWEHILLHKTATFLPYAMPLFAFSTTVLLPGKLNRPSPFLSKRCALPVKCTAAPERTKISKKSSPSQYYRVLPDDLPTSERPPQAPRHNSIPYVGLFIEYFLGLFDCGFTAQHKKYGPIYFSNFFLGPCFYLSSYGAACDILKNDGIFKTKGAMPALEALFGEDNMMMLSGKDHELARSAMAPAFSSALFPYYMKNVVKRTLQTWRRVEGAVRKDGSTQLDPTFREHYLAITIEMSTGIEVKSERSSVMRNLFADFVKLFISSPILPSYKRGIEARDKIRAILRDVIIENITRRRDIIEKLREYGDDIVKLGIKDISSGNVDILLVSIANSSLSTDENEPLDEELIGALGRSISGLWLAGYLTSAVTSTCGIFELGFRDDVLSRLMKEQDAIMDTGEREVTYEQVQSKMPLLDAYLMEILRLFPAADGLPRKTTRDVEILGKFVPGGSKVRLNFSGPHTDENLYVSGKEIILERWLQHPKPPPILTFGGPGSAHYCIGAAFSKMMMKATFATLLREYTFQLDPKQSRKYRLLPDHVPESGVVVNKFERRT